MSGTYYVFLKWMNSNDDNTAAQWGRYMLCFPSKYDADELFRAMQGLLAPNKSGPLFTTLLRQSANFWVYDTPSWETIIYLQSQQKNYLPAFRDRFSSLLLSDANGHRMWPTIDVPYLGSDWISGGEFFIRNRRQTDMYWWALDNEIRIGSCASQRSKFRITKISTEGMRQPIALIRDDEVIIQVVPETRSTSANSHNTNQGTLNVGVECMSDARSQLHILSSEWKWRLGSLLNRDVAVWSQVLSEANDTVSTSEVLIHTTQGGGDEWELV